jgi:cytochrome P450
MLNGSLPFRVKSFHDEYGSIVRIATDKLSFIDADAWKDIYHRKEFVRPQIWGSRPPGVEAQNVISAPVSDHARFRRAFQSAFSEKATQQHEVTVNKYVDVLIHRLEEATEKRGDQAVKIVLVQWINFTVFDVIGDLGWGASFGCLEDQIYHPWVKVVLHFKQVLQGTSVRYYPWLDAFLMSILPKSAFADLERALSHAHTKVKARLSRTPDHPDVMAHIVEYNQANPKVRLTDGEIEANSMAIVVAGSETITTVLSGAIHHLLQNPSVAERLDEIRSKFPSEDQITASAVASMPYFNAVVNETLRMCPPFPDNLRREVPQGGATICGHHISEKMTVGVPCWATFYSETNFVSPHSFSPERWLNEKSSATYQNDNRSASHPFSTGPHNCMGQPLAWAELRLILARLLWNFDVSVPVGSTLSNWTDQKIYWTWEKQPLEVNLKVFS